MAVLTGIRFKFIRRIASDDINRRLIALIVMRLSNIKTMLMNAMTGNSVIAHCLSMISRRMDGNVSGDSFFFHTDGQKHKS